MKKVPKNPFIPHKNEQIEIATWKYLCMQLKFSFIKKNSHINPLSPYVPSVVHLTKISISK